MFIVRAIDDDVRLVIPDAWRLWRRHGWYYVRKGVTIVRVWAFRDDADDADGRWATVEDIA